MLNRSCNR